LHETEGTAEGHESGPVRGTIKALAWREWKRHTSPQWGQSVCQPRYEVVTFRIQQHHSLGHFDAWNMPYEW